MGVARLSPARDIKTNRRIAYFTRKGNTAALSRHFNIEKWDTETGTNERETDVEGQNKEESRSFHGGRQEGNTAALPRHFNIEKRDTDVEEQTRERRI